MKRYAAIYSPRYTSRLMMPPRRRVLVGNRLELRGPIITFSYWNPNCLSKFRESLASMGFNRLQMKSLAWGGGQMKPAVFRIINSQWMMWPVCPAWDSNRQFSACFHLGIARSWRQ